MKDLVFGALHPQVSMSPSSFDVNSGQPQWARIHSTDSPVPSPVTRIRNQLTTMPWHRDQNMKVLRPWSLVVDGNDPPCIRDTLRDVQRHMGASTWVKVDQESVKITSRKLKDTGHFRPFDDSWLGHRGAVTRNT